MFAPIADFSALGPRLRRREGLQLQGFSSCCFLCHESHSDDVWPAGFQWDARTGAIGESRDWTLDFPDISWWLFGLVKYAEDWIISIYIPAQHGTQHEQMITDAPLEGGYVFAFYLGKKLLDLLTYIFFQKSLTSQNCGSSQATGFLQLYTSS